MIQIQGLQKSFAHAGGGGNDPRERDGQFYAVQDVSLQVAQGTVMGLLGPNGAGKTTTLRMLSTALTPSGGRIVVDGVDLTQDPLAARRKLGFMSGSTALYNRLSVRENMAYFGQAHGLNASQLQERIADLLQRLDMQDYADRRVEKLSAGMKQRALIARTVIHQPKVLILDEPTTGLDILGSQLVLDFIADYQRRGNTIIFSTHHLHEVEALCQEICVIEQGISVFKGSVSQLRGQGGGSLVQGYLQLLRQPSHFSAQVIAQAA